MEETVITKIKNGGILQTYLKIKKDETIENYPLCLKDGAKRAHEDWRSKLANQYNQSNLTNYDGNPENLASFDRNSAWLFNTSTRQIERWKNGENINTDFEYLNEANKLLNIQAVRGDFEAIKEFGDDEKRAASLIHQIWMDNNKWEEANYPHLFVPFDNLSVEEQNKDRMRYRIMKECLLERYGSYEPVKKSNTGGRRTRRRKRSTRRRKRSTHLRRRR